MSMMSVLDAHRAEQMVHVSMRSVLDASFTSMIRRICQLAVRFLTRQSKLSMLSQISYGNDLKKKKLKEASFPLMGLVVGA